MATVSIRSNTTFLCTTCSKTHLRQEKLTDGRTSPFHTAASTDCSTCIIKLNNSGSRRRTFSSSSIDDNGLSALHIAASASNDAAVEALLGNPETERNPRDPLGLTPLHRAALAGSTKVIKLLLADPKTDLTLVSRSGKTPMHLAASAGKYFAAKALLEANADPLAFDDKLNTPIELASNNGFDNLVALIRRTLSKE